MRFGDWITSEVGVPIAMHDDKLPMTCDICGSTDIVEIRCKVVCRNCGTILQSCADLADERP
jgi:hypothetical protein